MSGEQADSYTLDAQCMIQGIYTKSVSFKSLLLPKASRSRQPKAHVKVSISNSQVEPRIYEVVLDVSVQAENTSGKICYEVAFCQAGLFQTDGLVGAALETQLYVGCPEVLFAYARELMDSLLVRGGFQPLAMIMPDFSRLHAALKGRQKKLSGPDLWQDVPEEEPTAH